MSSADAAAPLVSVITAVHNGERYLAEAIESVLNQTFRNFEYLLLDDGSTDASGAILERYAGRDPRIVLMTHPNMGVAATENRGLQAARGTWVAILDQDDVWLPQRLERQLAAAAARPNVKVWAAYAWRTGPDGRRLRVLRVGPTTEAEFWRIRAGSELLPLLHPSVLMDRATVLELGGYDVALNGASDPDLWSRIADNHLIQVLPEPLFEYRMHGTSVMTTQLVKLERYHRWIELRQRFRRAGRRMPGYAAFLAYERALPWPKRASNLRRERGTVSLRKAQLAWLSGRPVAAAAHGGHGVLLNPGGLLKRLRRAVGR